MTFDTDITAPASRDVRCDGPFGRDVPLSQTKRLDGAGALRPDLGPKGEVIGALEGAPLQRAALHAAALLLLPVYLPVMAVWVMWSMMGGLRQRLWFSSASLFDDNDVPLSVDDYVFKASDLYSGPCFAPKPVTGGAPHPNQAAFNHISTMIYLFRPKAMERPLPELMARPTIIMEFFARVLKSRVEMFQLGDVPNGVRDMWLMVVAALFGGTRVFMLSSGLSPEPPVPE